MTDPATKLENRQRTYLNRLRRCADRRGFRIRKSRRRDRRSPDFGCWSCQYKQDGVYLSPRRGDTGSHYSWGILRVVRFLNPDDKPWRELQKDVRDLGLR